MSSSRKPVLLVIRDGWGKNPDASQNDTNAVFLAKKACDDALQAKYPHTLVSASGLAGAGKPRNAARSHHVAAPKEQPKQYRDRRPSSGFTSTSRAYLLHTLNS
jgi:hypothetical protein